jgi:hypothetical protein
MRTAIVIAMISVLGVAAGRFEARHDANNVPVKMPRVRVVKDPVITADMLSPKLTRPQGPSESRVASLGTR